jgi:hypothetical protein
MRSKLIFACFFMILGATTKGAIRPQEFEKAEFYEIMKSTSLDAINNEIELVKTAAPEKERGGYEGALLMKKAGLLKRPKERLSFFKQGRIKLETAIVADNENTEFRFLRLAIEEHAPKIVKYHSDIERDKALVVKNFKTLSPVVRHAILDYCENSKVLHKEEF